MDTCGACGAFLQPEWNRCKICGADRAAADAPPSPGPGSGVTPAPSGPSNRPDTKVVVGAAILALIVLVAGFVIFSGGHDSGEPSAVISGGDAEGLAEPALLGGMCDDPSEPAGEPLDGEPGYHGTQMYTGTGKVSGTYERHFGPDGWTRAETQVVACATRTEAVPTHECVMSGDSGATSFTMHRTSWDIVVYDAGTGETLTTAQAEGTNTECPTVTMVDPGQRDFFADPDGFDDIVRSFAEVPDETGSVPLDGPDPLPEDLPDECPRQPFDLTISDGPDVRPVSVPGAVAVENDDKVQVWFADFAFSASDVTYDDPPFDGRGSWATLFFSGAALHRDTLKAGDVVTRVGSPEAEGARHTVNVVVHPNQQAERLNADPSNRQPVNTGTATVLYNDGEVLCLDLDLTSDLGASAIGVITATWA
jgi:hypothetical protein